MNKVVQKILIILALIAMLGMFVLSLFPNR